MGTFITRLLLFALVAPERLDGPLDAARHTPRMNWYDSFSIRPRNVGGRFSGSCRVYVSDLAADVNTMRARPRAQRTHAQLRDSPGARLRSTASIAGWTSNVGSGVSGSTSSSPPAAPPVPIPSPRPIPGPPDGAGCPDEKSENIDGVCARCVGFHAGGWGAGVVGESSERREDDTEVLRPCRGLLADGR